MRRWLQKYAPIIVLVWCCRVGWHDWHAAYCWFCGEHRKGWPDVDRNGT